MRYFFYNNLKTVKWEQILKFIADEVLLNYQGALAFQYLSQAFTKTYINKKYAYLFYHFGSSYVLNKIPSSLNLCKIAKLCTLVFATAINCSEGGATYLFLLCFVCCGLSTSAVTRWWNVKLMLRLASVYKHCVLLCSCYKRRNTDLSLCEGVPLFLHATKVRILPWKSCGLSRFWKQPQVATCGTAVSVTSVQTSFFSLCCFLKLDEMTDDKSKFLMILVKTGAHKAFYSIHLKTLMSLYYAPIQELHNISLTKVRAWW